jgi:uncharacterized protein YuzE
MRMRYDREGDTLDILLDNGQIHHAEEHEQIIVDYNKKGKIVEIEILDASRLLGRFLSEILKVPKRGAVELG